jgi:membrane-bound lytic murein transglycosylase A
VPLERGAYPLFSDRLAFNHLDNAIKTSLDYLGKLPPDQQIAFGADTYTVAHLKRSLKVFQAFIARRPSTEKLNTFVADYFLVYRSTGRPDRKDVLFTGYYEPILQGRRSPDKKFSVPVHSRPADLLDIDLSLFAPDLKGRRIIGRREGRTVVPYFDRGQIRQQADFNRIAPPVAWLRDEVDLFILQIQGSGRVDFGDGSFAYIQFNGSNGLPYRSVGRMLIDTGKIAAKDMSMKAIRNYLRRHPMEKAAIMDYNPRYVFFHEGSGPPVGTLGVPLTAMRSIAVDRKVIPMAALAFFTTDLADVDTRGNITGWSPYNGFALTQDTGSAITGPGRVDIFWGHGLQAEVGAGHLKHSGRLYLLVLRKGKDSIGMDAVDKNRWD